MDFYNYINYNYFEPRNDLPWILDYENKSVQFNISKAINIIKASISDENEDATFYESIIALTPTKEAKEIIEGITSGALKD